MSSSNLSKGLTVDEIHTLIHDPDKFTLTLENMSDTYTLAKNLIELFKII